MMTKAEKQKAYRERKKAGLVTPRPEVVLKGQVTKSFNKAVSQGVAEMADQPVIKNLVEVRALAKMNAYIRLNDAIRNAPVKDAIAAAKVILEFEQVKPTQSFDINSTVTQVDNTKLDEGIAKLSDATLDELIDKLN